MKITQLKIYPLKSGKGMSLKSVKITRRGLEYDRQWMLVNEYDVFISQRKFPRMALISCDPFSGKEEVTFHAPGMPSLPIALDGINAGKTRVSIWKDTCSAVRFPPNVDEWFSSFLGMKCKLVYMSDDDFRPVPGIDSPKGWSQNFTDGFPVLLTTEISLSDLNSRLSSPVSMDRFRPNIVVDGELPYEEDRWRWIRIGDIRFHIAKPCARCVVINVDQITGKSLEEPLKTLSTYRSDNRKVLFGQNLIHEGTGRISVGDEVRVLD